MSARRPKVVIVGAGFGGLEAAKALDRGPVDVQLVARHTYHLFQPLLYQVATAGLEPEEIAYPVRRILARRRKVRFRLGEVRRVDLDGQRLETTEGAIEYDYLILAGGSDNNFFGNGQLAETSHGLKDLDQAVTLRNQVLRCFERADELDSAEARRPLLTFVVAGGGPTGVEYAGALAELTDLLLTKDHPSLPRDEVQIVLVEGGPALLPMLPTRLQRAALRELRRKRIDVRLGTLITGHDGSKVALNKGEPIAACTLMWAAGVRAADLSGELGVETGRAGRVPVEPTLQLAGHPEVYVIGDMALPTGAPVPMVAPGAIQEGQLAARNILRQLQGLAPAPFHYRDKGTLATIGRKAAVASIGPLRLSGALAWFAWLGLHLVMLIGFRNRVVVLLNWAWNYVTYDRALRLITK